MDIVDKLRSHADGEFDMTPLGADLLAAIVEIEMLRATCRKLRAEQPEPIESSRQSAAGKSEKSLAQSILGGLRA